MKPILAAVLALVALPAAAQWIQAGPEDQARFAAADTNGDGRVDLAEAGAVWPGITARELAVHDANRDGGIDVYEFTTIRLSGPVVEPGD